MIVSLVYNVMSCHGGHNDISDRLETKKYDASSQNVKLALFSEFYG
jgi:hypothetical protein